MNTKFRHKSSAVPASATLLSGTPPTSGCPRTADIESYEPDPIKLRWDRLRLPMDTQNPQLWHHSRSTRSSSRAHEDRAPELSGSLRAGFIRESGNAFACCLCTAEERGWWKNERMRSVICENSFLGLQIEKKCWFSREARCES